MKKIIALIGIIFLFSLMCVPSASASVIASSTASGDSMISNTIKDIKDGTETLACAEGESFNATVTEYIHNITVRIKVGGGSPNATLYAALVSLNGEYGVSDYPNALLNTTLGFQADTSTLSGSFNNVTFEFADVVELTANSKYGFYVYAGSGTCDNTNYFQVDGDTADSYSGSRMVSTPTWNNYSGDMYFIINGDASEPTVTPTPVPSAAPSGDGDADMEALVNAILPWLVPLLICLIPALLGYKFVGELGFFIGLNVGCILAYVTLSGTAYAFPLWGIILVGVMDVAVVLMRR